MSGHWYPILALSGLSLNLLGSLMLISHVVDPCILGPLTNKIARTCSPRYRYLIDGIAKLHPAYAEGPVSQLLIYDPSQSGQYDDLDFSDEYRYYEAADALETYPEGKETHDEELIAIAELLTEDDPQEYLGVSKIAMISIFEKDPYVEDQYEDHLVLIGYGGEGPEKPVPGETTLSRLRAEVSTELDWIRGRIGAVALSIGFAVQIVAQIIRLFLS